MRTNAKGTADQRWLVALIVPLLLLLILTALRVDFDLNLRDEGFLWYGAQRTSHGEVPLRDFMAYDPGRYYWTASWMWLVRDDGIVAMRWSAVLFEALAVAATAMAVWRETRSLAISLLSSSSCIILMNAWYGRYEPSVALLQVVALAWLMERPGETRFVLNGLLVGVATVFGRNLGLYGFLGLIFTLLLLAYLDRRHISWRRLSLTVAGGIIGVLPLAAMLLFVHGYAVSYGNSILRHFELGATNLTLPIPWPWKLPYPGWPWGTPIQQFVLGLFLLIMPVFGIGIVALGLLKNRRLLTEHPLFTSAAILSLPYAHYVFSRADLEHLSRGGAPLMLALIVIPALERPGWRAAPAVVLTAVLAALWPAIPLRLLPERVVECRKVMVGKDRLCLQDDVAGIVEGARGLVARFVGPDESVLIAPYHQTLYPALGLKAPNWELYAIFPQDQQFELAEITRIEEAHTRLAILYTLPVDNRPELRYSATHPLIANSLLSRFMPVPQRALPPSFVALVRP